MTSGGWRRSGDAPKIVHIETRYVETDAINFRHVVQSLTGKNSSSSSSSSIINDYCLETTAAPSSSFTTECSSYYKNNNNNREGTAHHHDVSVSTKPEEVAHGISPMALKNVSFKDFDRLLADLPPMEDLLW